MLLACLVCADVGMRGLCGAGGGVILDVLAYIGMLISITHYVSHTRARTHTHTRAHTRARAHTHTHTHPAVRPGEWEEVRVPFSDLIFSCRCVTVCV